MLSADIHQSHIVIYVIVCYHFPFTSAHSILAATKRLINQIGSSLHLIHTSVVHRPVLLQNYLEPTSEIQTLYLFRWQRNSPGVKTTVPVTKQNLL